MNISAITGAIDDIEALTGKVFIGQPTQLEGISDPPYCWINGIMESASPSTRVAAPSIQRIDVRVSILVGAKDLATVLSTRDDIRAALIDLQPDDPGDPLQYRVGKLDALDLGWVAWQDEYTYAYYYDKLTEVA